MSPITALAAAAADKEDIRMLRRSIGKLHSCFL